MDKFGVGSIIACYGSLRLGETADLSQRATHMGTATINGTLHSLSWYPGVDLITGLEAFSSELPQVVVDLFRIDDEATARWLDLYEGHPELFLRTKTQALVGASGDEDDTILEVWVYSYPHAYQLTEDNRVLSGDWRQREGAFQDY